MYLTSNSFRTVIIITSYVGHLMHNILTSFWQMVISILQMPFAFFMKCPSCKHTAFIFGLSDLPLRWLPVVQNSKCLSVRY